MTPFPWEKAIGFGLGVLKLSPETFWRMTPRELAFAVRGMRGDAPPLMKRDDLAALMRTFPDEVCDG